MKSLIRWMAPLALLLIWAWLPCTDQRAGPECCYSSPAAPAGQYRHEQLSSRSSPWIPAIAVLAFPGWGIRNSQNRKREEYAELVRLRGATVTMLQTHRISVDEACAMRTMLDRARQAV